MEKYSNVLRTVKLFEGIAPEQLDAMLACLDAKTIGVRKGDFLLSAGESAAHVGIVLAGQLHIVREDIHGGRALLAALTKGGIFAETLCCAGVMESPVSVIAESDGSVMLLAFQRILHTCSGACVFHAKLIENMLRVIAAKNLQLQARMELLSRKSIRERVLAYLESIAARQGRAFSIPLNREGLADFLCVDRSALSRELGRLKEAGVIDFWKNNFKMLK